MQRLRVPDYVAGLGGAALLASLAVDGFNVWLAITGALAVGLLVVTAAKDAPALPVAFDVLTTWAALIAIPVVAVRGEAFGAVALAALLAGAWWAMRKQDGPGLRPPPETRAMPTPSLSADAEP